MIEFSDSMKPHSGDAILKMEKLCKNYQLGSHELRVLREIDITINSGEYVAIMGPSGSGKSTLLNMIGCLDRPSSGSYLLGGQDVSRLEDDDLSAIRGARIGFVFQSFNLIAQLNVIENIEIPMFYQNYGEEQSAARAMELAGPGGAGGPCRPPAIRVVRGGQQQRVAIARALANDPLIILADEPTGNLDSSSGADILDILDRLHDEGKTLVVVTHDEGIATHAQRVIRLFDGRIAEDTYNYHKD